MAMRNRPSILEDLSVRHAWQDTDPGSLTLPLKQRKAERQCHCPTRVANALQHGMKPLIDLDAKVIRCGHCLAPVGPACRTRKVQRLRGLLSLAETKPEFFDEADARDAGLLWEPD